MSTIFDKYEKKIEDEKPSILDRFNQEAPTGDEPSLLDTFQASEQSRGESLFDAAPKLLPHVKPEPDRDLYDVTIGAAQYGGAETLGLFARGIDRSFVKSDSLTEFAQSMERFKNLHPEYSPVEVQSAQQLISNPAALSSNIFSGAAYLGINAGTMMIPGVGIPLTMATGYTIEAQRAYEQAKMFGSDEESATQAGKWSGTVGAFFSVLDGAKLVKIAKGERSVLAERMMNSANAYKRSLGPGVNAAQDAVMVAGLGALQGGINEGIALSTYGKPIEKGFWDRRLQEGAIGAATSVLLGSGSRVIKKVLGKGLVTDDPTSNREIEINVFDRDSAISFFNERGVPSDSAKAMGALADGFASQWSERTRAPKERWFNSVLNEDNFKVRPENDNGSALAADMESLLASFDQSPVKVVDAFLNAAVKNMTDTDKADLMKGLKLENVSPEEADIKMQKAFVRYLWNGKAPAPELQYAFDSMREVLKDAYKKVSALGAKKIGPETRAVLDGLLSRETEEISGARERISNLEDAIKVAFPEQPSARKGTVSPEFLEDLMNPVEESKTTFVTLPNEELPVEVTSTTRRKRTKAEVKKAIEDKLSEGLQPEAGKSPSSETFFHGSPNTKLTFLSQPRTGPLGDGTYLTSTEAIARTDAGNKGKVYRAEVDLKKGFKSDDFLNESVIDEARKLWSERKLNIDEFPGDVDVIWYVDVLQSNHADTWREALIRAGYDHGIDTNPDHPQVIVLDPKKVKLIPGEFSNIEGLDRNKTEARLLLDNAYAELDRLQKGRLIPDEMSAIARRSQPDGWQRDQLNVETPVDTRNRWKLWEHLDPIRAIINIGTPLERWTWGKKIKETLGNVVAFARRTSGVYEEEIVNTYRSLTWKERRWLQTVDDEGFSNMRKLVDTQGVNTHISQAPSENIARLRELSWKINLDMGRMAERLGVTMLLPDGREVPYKQPQQGRMIRFPTDDARRAVQTKQGSIYHGIVEAAKRFNPELRGKDLKTIGGMLDNIFVDPEIKKNSALETARVFKIMPDVIDVNGKKIAIYHIEPIKYLRQAVRSQAQRLGWVHEIGQSRIESASIKQLKQVAKEFGVAPIEDEYALAKRINERLLGKQPEEFPVVDGEAKELRDKLQQIEQTPDEKVQARIDKRAEKRKKSPRPAGTIKRELVDTAALLTSHDLADTPSAMRKAIELAREVGVSVHPTRQEYIDAIMKVTATNMDAKEVAKMRVIARRLKGVDDSLPPDELLSEIKSRLKEEPLDYMETLQKNLSAESGGIADEYATMVVKSSQGIPLNINNRTWYTRGVKSLSTVIGTLHTSLSVVVNVPQTLFLVPKFGGIKNYLMALHDTVHQFKATKSDIEAFGAMPDTFYSYGTEPGYRLEGWTRNFRQAFTTATGLKFVADFNNVVAGETFKRLALSWKADPDGIGIGDVRTMKSLKLTPDEIKAVQAGSMSDLTFAKIVQRGVDLTQYTTTSGHERGTLEHNPLMSMLFAYSNYAIGTARAMGEWFHNDFANLENLKNPKAAIQALGTTSVLLGSALGAGMLSRIMRDIAKGDANREMDETVRDKMVGALFEISILGPSQRFIDAFRFSGGDEEKMFLGMMPQLKAVINGMSALYNQVFAKPVLDKSTTDAFAKFGFVDNVAEAAKRNTPILKAFVNWMDKAQYPEHVNYLEVKAHSAKFKRDQSDVLGSSGGEPKDPNREKVFFYVARNDSEAAVKAAQQYYQEEVDKLMKNPMDAIIKGDGPDSISRRLRSSLLSRAPINIESGLEKVNYLSKLPKDKLVRYYQTDMQYRLLVDLVAPN
jgi:hypothetical protein